LIQDESASLYEDCEDSDGNDQSMLPEVTNKLKVPKNSMQVFLKRNPSFKDFKGLQKRYK